MKYYYKFIKASSLYCNGIFKGILPDLHEGWHKVFVNNNEKITIVVKNNKLIYFLLIL